MFSDIVLWIVWFPLRLLIQRLPLKLVNFTGKLIGIVLYVFSKRKRDLMSRELAFLFSKTSSLDQKTIKKMTYEGLQIFSKRQVENLYMGKSSPELLDRMVSIEGIENLDNTLKKNNGAILLTAHFGSHMLPPLALGFKGYKIHQLAGVPLIDKQSPIHRKIFEVRLRESEKLPINFILVGNYMRSVFNTLRKNEILFIAFDGGEGNRWFQADIFGHKAFFAPGPFKLSLKTKAPILPTFIIRQRDDRHRLIIEPPFEFELAKDEEGTLALNIAKFAKTFERYIKQYPCHYAMTLMRVEELIKEGALETNLFQNVNRAQERKNI